jgi:hypothetical protein
MDACFQKSILGAFFSISSLLPFYPSNLLWLRLQAAPGNREFVRDIRLMPGLIREEEAEE